MMNSVLNQGRSEKDHRNVVVAPPRRNVNNTVCVQFYVQFAYCVCTVLDTVRLEKVGLCRFKIRSTVDGIFISTVKITGTDNRYRSETKMHRCYSLKLSIPFQIRAFTKSTVSDKKIGTVTNFMFF